MVQAEMHVASLLDIPTLSLEYGVEPSSILLLHRI